MTRRKTSQPKTAQPKTRQTKPRQPKPKQPKTRQPKARRPKASTHVVLPEPRPGSDRTSVTFYLEPELRARTRAAYRATASLEGDSSWSDLVRKALVAEVVRRERRHNAGIAFAGDSLPLPPGRPASES